jgi:YHS domain-containing protein
MKRTLLAVVGAVMFAGSAMAGQQYVDKTGFAVSGYDVMSYWSQKQTPVGKVQVKAVPGKASITAEYNGAKWAFATKANRDKFKANPAKYAPVFDGHCAYGVSVGGKVPANPNLWRIVDDKLYLNITKVVVGFWEEDIHGHIKTGNKNWSKKFNSKPAAKRKVPSFDIAMAPL